MGPGAPAPKRLRMRSKGPHRCSAGHSSAGLAVPAEPAAVPVSAGGRPSEGSGGPVGAARG
eukprot:4343742-Alexandrium_andersonii.AAC.1